MEIYYKPNFIEGGADMKGYLTFSIILLSVLSLFGANEYINLPNNKNTLGMNYFHQISDEGRILFSDIYEKIDDRNIERDSRSFGEHYFWQDKTVMVKSKEFMKKVENNPPQNEEIIANNPPNKPFNPYPAKNEEDIKLETDNNHDWLKLSWAATDSDDDTLIYDVYFGENFNELELISENIK